MYASRFDIFGDVSVVSYPDDGLRYVRTLVRCCALSAVCGWVLVESAVSCLELPSLEALSSN